MTSCAQRSILGWTAAASFQMGEIGVKGVDASYQPQKQQQRDYIHMKQASHLSIRNGN